MPSMRLPGILASVLALAIPFSSADDNNVEVTPGRVILYAADPECWSIFFTGPAGREAILRKNAQERFETPAAASLAEAKRQVVEVDVVPGSRLECGGEVPETIVVRDATDSNTITKVPLIAKKEVRSNAFGAGKVFSDGHTLLSFPTFRAAFGGADRVIYLVTTDGRHGGWKVGKEMTAVDDLPTWQAGQHEKAVATIRTRFEDACGGKPAAWLALDILVGYLNGSIGNQKPEDVRSIGKEYLPCLERLASDPESDGTRASATKVLSMLKQR